jgi:hypothetical protein
MAPYLLPARQLSTVTVTEFGICERFTMARRDDVDFRAVEVPASYYPAGGSPRESWRTL